MGLYISSDESRLVGSFSSMTEGSSQSVKASARPGCALRKMNAWAPFRDAFLSAVAWKAARIFDEHKFLRGRVLHEPLRPSGDIVKSPFENKTFLHCSVTCRITKNSEATRCQWTRKVVLREVSRVMHEHKCDLWILTCLCPLESYAWRLAGGIF